jgi:hypothetical protein
LSAQSTRIKTARLIIEARYFTMVIVRTGFSSTLGVVPEEGARVRPAWVAARERRPFFHHKDREGPQQPALAGNDCEQLRSIVLVSHRKKDGEESEQQDGKKIKPPRPSNRPAPTVLMCKECMVPPS